MRGCSREIEFIECRISLTQVIGELKTHRYVQRIACGRITDPIDDATLYSVQGTSIWIRIFRIEDDRNAFFQSGQVSYKFFGDLKGLRHDSLRHR